mmetsp:Transcript_50600/g.162530  ORF Transcript_50600/g.162530 Transcript_50600/m.162530 type:complete len:116 (+) Transcript_50600:97-444(+)
MSNLFIIKPSFFTSLLVNKGEHDRPSGTLPCSATMKSVAAGAVAVVIIINISTSMSGASIVVSSSCSSSLSTSVHSPASPLADMATPAEGGHRHTVQRQAADKHDKDRYPKNHSH